MLPQSFRGCTNNAVVGLSKRDAGMLALATTSSPAFLDTYAPARIRSMTVVTPRQVLDLTRSAQVGTIRHFSKEDPEKTASIIKLHLMYLNKICDVKRPLNEEQIDFIADAVMNDFDTANLTLVDFMVVMRRAAMGQYEIFESLTPPKVMNWLKKYAEERATTAAEMSREENERYKGDPTRSRYKNEQAQREYDAAAHAAAVEHLKKKYEDI